MKPRHSRFNLRAMDHTYIHTLNGQTFSLRTKSPKLGCNRFGTLWRNREIALNGNAKLKVFPIFLTHADLCVAGSSGGHHALAATTSPTATAPAPAAAAVTAALRWVSQLLEAQLQYQSEVISYRNSVTYLTFLFLCLSGVFDSASRHHLPVQFLSMEPQLAGRTPGKTNKVRITITGALFPPLPFIPSCSSIPISSSNPLLNAADKKETPHTRTLDRCPSRDSSVHKAHTQSSSCLAGV